MSIGRMTLFLACAVILGFLSFALLGYVVEYRNGLPLPGSAPPNGAYLGKFEKAAAGAHSAVALARRALENGNTGACGYGLDAAYRITEVGRDAASGSCKLRFIQAVEAIKKARRQLHNGSREKTLKKIAVAEKELKTACRGIRPYETEPFAAPPEKEWNKYNGVELVDAQGVRIGELVRLYEDASGKQAELRLGSRDVFGFWDFSGKKRVVAADRLIYGKPKIFGSTIVCFPTFHNAGGFR